MDDFVYLMNGNIEKIALDDSWQNSIVGRIGWTGFENRYFIAATILKENSGTELRLIKLRDDLLAYRLVSSPVTIFKNNEFRAFYSCYLGPKDLDILKTQGENLATILDFGWFDFVSKPLLIALKYSNKLTGNYGIDIIILTIIIKIIFFPLSHKSYKSMKKMQELQPMITKLRERYKDDKERMNREVMGLYRSQKANPLGGCLPMLLQFPVFIALYKVLLVSIELRHAPFIFWIQDLSAKDPYYITPLLMGASMFIQQKMTPTAGDPTQAKMMLMMPVVFTFLFLSFPSGLVIYWLVNNVLSISQQLYTNKYIS